MTPLHTLLIPNVCIVCNKYKIIVKNKENLNIALQNRKIVFAQQKQNIPMNNIDSAEMTVSCFV